MKWSERPFTSCFSLSFFAFRKNTLLNSWCSPKTNFQRRSREEEFYFTRHIANYGKKTRTSSLFFACFSILRVAHNVCHVMVVASPFDTRIGVFTNPRSLLKLWKNSKVRKRVTQWLLILWSTVNTNKLLCRKVEKVYEFLTFRRESALVAYSTGDLQLEKCLCHSACAYMHSQDGPSQASDSMPNKCRRKVVPIWESYCTTPWCQ